MSSENALTLANTLWDQNDVTRIEYRGGYIYHITFDDGTAGEVDFSIYLNGGPVFAPLRDKTFFQKAFIDGGSIAWPNDADIAPEALYDKLHGWNGIGERVKKTPDKMRA